MFGRARRAQVAEDLATLRTKYATIRHQYAEKAAECETWKAQAAPAGRIADQLITRTRERDTAVRELRATEDQLGAARRENATRTGRMVAYSDQAVGNMRRLARALRACARYRAEIAGQRQEIRQLTDRLFDSLGYLPVDRARLDTPAVKETAR